MSRRRLLETVAVVGLLLVMGVTLAERTPLCACHGYRLKAELLPAPAIAVDMAVAVVVYNNGSEYGFSLPADGVLNLGLVEPSKVKKVSFRLSVPDLDQAVCEIDTRDPYASVYATEDPKLRVSVPSGAVEIRMKEKNKGEGVWYADWKATAGAYRFALSGTFFDAYEQHAKSNDPQDLSFAQMFQSKIILGDELTLKADFNPPEVYATQASTLNGSWTLRS